MPTTPVSLLVRLRLPGEQDSWGRFVNLYTPLLLHWARRFGLQNHDADDLVQKVFLTLVQKLPEFQYDPAKRFRGWLWTVTRNTFRRGWAKPAAVPAASAAALDELAAANHEDPEEAEYRRHVMARALQLMQTDFQPTTWKACWERVVCARPAAAVAADLGISVGAVYVATSHVLQRLREELRGLLD